MTREQYKSMSELLRKAVAACGNLTELERQTGVSHQSSMMFLRGGSLRLDKADALARPFGIRCIASRTKKGERKR